MACDFIRSAGTEAMHIADGGHPSEQQPLIGVPVHSY